MPKLVEIDEIHLTIRIPADLSDTAVVAVRRTLARDEFMGRLRRAIRLVIRTSPDLHACRLIVSR